MGTGVFHHDAAVFQHVAVVGGVQRHVGVLLDQQNGGAALAVDAHHDLEDLLGQLGGQAQAGLVQQDQLGRGHQRAADGQHLLLAARQQAGVLRPALPQDREVRVHLLHVARHAVAVAAGVGAHQQVVVHRQQREHFAPLGHVREPLLHDEGRVAGGDVLALEVHAALARVDDARDGLEDGGLACAVAAQHGGDLALFHLQADAADGLDGAVGAFDVGQLQDHRAHACLRSEDTSSIEPR